MTHPAVPAIPPFEITIQKESLALWAGILHDPNPIHLDAVLVQAKGWGTAEINQGPANLAYVINALTQAFPDGAIESLDVQFLGNTFAGETVTASATIIDREERPDARRFVCEIQLVAGERSKVLGGRAVVVEPLSDK